MNTKDKILGLDSTQNSQVKDKNSDKSAIFVVRLKASNEPKSVLGGKLFYLFKIPCEKSFDEHFWRFGACVVYICDLGCLNYS